MARDDTPNTASVGATERSFRIIEQLGEREGCGVSGWRSRCRSRRARSTTTSRRSGSWGTSFRTATSTDSGCSSSDWEIARASVTTLYHVVKPETDSLVEAVGERAQVMVEEGGVGIYVYQSLADQAVRTDSHIGTVVDLPRDLGRQGVPRAPFRRPTRRAA